MKKAAVKQVRKRYSKEFKQQALARAEKDGVAQVSKDLGTSSWGGANGIHGTDFALN